MKVLPVLPLIAACATSCAAVPRPAEPVSLATAVPLREVARPFAPASHAIADVATYEHGRVRLEIPVGWLPSDLPQPTSPSWISPYADDSSSRARATLTETPDSPDMPRAVDAAKEEADRAGGHVYRIAQQPDQTLLEAILPAPPGFARTAIERILLVDHSLYVVTCTSESPLHDKDSPETAIVSECRRVVSSLRAAR